MPEQGDVADPTRARLIRSCFDWSSVEEVAEAISHATDHERSIYAERLGCRYRWSLVHPGGAYPLLRISARYLRINYTKIVIGFRTLDNGLAVLWDSRADQTPPDRWTILTFDEPIDQKEAQFRLQLWLDESTAV